MKYLTTDELEGVTGLGNELRDESGRLVAFFFWDEECFISKPFRWLSGKPFKPRATKLEADKLAALAATLLSEHSHD